MKSKVVIRKTLTDKVMNLVYNENYHFVSSVLISKRSEENSFSEVVVMG